MENIYEESLFLHKKLRGKISIQNKMDVFDTHDLSLVYSPGVAEPCRAIANDPEQAYALTMKKNTIAIVTDGSAVLGLGNIGAKAALPVMEGKAMLFKKFANVDAFPLCLDTQDENEIIETVKRISPGFGGINLEDIASPRSFFVENSLQDLGIPVFHDDQHGTAIVALAALINATKLLGKKMSDLKLVINGAGAAGIAIASMLRCINFSPDICIPVGEVLICDRQGIIYQDRNNLSETKRNLLRFSNSKNQKGSLQDALKGANIFIGVSGGNLLSAKDIKTMAKDPIVLALANPTPEIMPEEAHKGGAAIVGTGRSDFPNQVNNVLAFPGIFRGALDARAKKITPKMKMAAAYAIANDIEKPNFNKIIPSSLDELIAYKVAKAVRKAATE